MLHGIATSSASRSTTVDHLASESSATVAVDATGAMSRASRSASKNLAEGDDASDLHGFR